ncbi:hypothetical protein 1 [Beihai picorna-like virus 39]|uniref:hypothetical protein 1 n=1 Tax=Beihai picorna-like virus 39 TaxID=1922582 RepID=UPI00090AF1B9|nr:hypothetical protein 1 [Beihai picorna-like virus 39]APG76871.1 hypothetical protein 1 [Beihai picorna-like virus 39]
MKIDQSALATFILSEEMANFQGPKVRDGVKAIKPQVGDFLNHVARTGENLTQLNDLMDRFRTVMEKVRSTIVFNDDDDVVEALMSRLEGLVIVILDCSTRESLTEMILPMMQYLKSWAPNKSIAMKAIGILNKILAEDAHGDRTEVHSGLNGQGGWFSSNWQMLTEGHFGKRLAGALNLLIICGILPEKMSSHIGDEMYKILHVQAMRKQHPSIFHHLFSTLDWVVDSVIPAFSTNNPALLLYDSDVSEIDEMYRNCLDMVTLNTSGQMERVKEKYGVSDEAELVVYITKTSAAHLAVKARSRGDAHIQREMQNRLIRLDKLQGDIQAYWHSKGLRVKPFGVLIRGPSSVGKSVLAGISCHAICRTMGFPEGEEYICSLNGSDKYQSEFRSQHICVIFDDMGNTKPEKADGNPLFILIQFINNMHCAALSPEAEKKGKNDIRSKVVVVTTNTTDLHSSFFSVNPTSIMRRFDLVVDAKLKDSAKSKSGGLHPRFAGQTHPDAWDLTLSTVDIVRSTSCVLADSWRLNVQKQTGVVGLVEYLAEVAPAFYKTQESIVESSSELHKKEHCAKHPLFCTPCPKCVRDNGFEPISATVLNKQNGLLFDKGAQDDFIKCYLEPDMLENNADPVADVEESDLSPLQRIDYICGQAICKLKDLFNTITKKVKQDPWLSAVALFSSVGLAAIAAYNMFTPPQLQAEGAVYSRINAAARKPENFIEKDNKYQKVYSNFVKQPDASVSTTLQQLETKIDRNLHVIFIQEFDEHQDIAFGPIQWGNAIPVGGGRWLMVGHQFQDGKTYHVKFRSHPNIGVKRFDMLINEANMTRIEGCDAVVVDAPQGGDTADFSKYMLDTLDDFEFHKGAPLIVYHAHHSQVADDCDDFKPPSSYRIASKLKSIENMKVNGVGYYDLALYEADNHDGMCGSPVFLAGRNPTFIGIHTAGSPSTRTCGVTLLAKDMLTRNREKVFIAEQGELPSELQGIEFTVNPDVHKYSPVHYIEDPDHNLEVFGQHNLPLSKFKSDVIESPLLEHMKEEMNYEPTHAAPPAKAANNSRRRHLLKTTERKPPSNPKYLAMAIKDLKKKIKRVVKKKGFREFVHPISYEDATNGVPGVKGFDPVNILSSMGFPANCPKHRCLVENIVAKQLGLTTLKYVKKEEINGKTVYSYEIHFDPKKVDVRRNAEGMLEVFLDGKRANVSFRTSLKDEALSLEKIADGVIRVIAGAQVDLVINTRILTLSLINHMTNFPDEFESAVGVDATGKDWGAIADFVTVFGEERCGDGDFSSFDTGIRAEFSAGAFEIIKFCLAECGYDDDLLTMMDGIATECMFPIYESDGLMFKALGSNPSGNPLTVVLNGFCNSLYLRYAYYAMHDVSEFGKIPLFHEVIALITYGDDNIFNVSEKEKLFNMQSLGRELARIGVKYTDASKQISSVPFKHFRELSFLKRIFNWHPQLGGYVGALEKKSINRSLALTRKPKKGQRESVAEICANNLNGALRELYYHSRQDYLDFLPIAKSMASKAVDSEGHRVCDYFTPITEAEIIEQYQRTKCVYYEAKERLEMEGQSGVLHEDPDIFYQRFEVLELENERFYNRAPSADWVVNRLFAIHNEFENMFHSPINAPRYSDNHIEMPLVETCHDVDFRYYCAYEHYDDVGPIVERDVRLVEGFAQDIVISAVEMRRRRGCHRAIAKQIEYMWEYALLPHVVPKRSDERAFKVARSVLTSRIELPFSQDVNTYIRDFYQGPLIRVRFPESMYCSVNLPIADVGLHMEPWTFQDYHNVWMSLQGQLELDLLQFPEVVGHMEI